MTENKLKALFYPDVPFETLFIPHIFKEIYIEGLYTDVFNQKENMTVIDVGANIGIVTHYMRQFSKKIYSIEPNSTHFEALKKNKEYNNWDNVEIFNMALADIDGEMRLNTFNENKTCHSLVNNYNQGGEMVKTMRFDSFLKENNIEEVDFVKFDVEGAEDMILRSEGFILAAPKIKSIEVEFHYPTWPQLVKHMEKLGFSARRYDSSAIVCLFFK